AQHSRTEGAADERHPTRCPGHRRRAPHRCRHRPPPAPRGLRHRPALPRLRRGRARAGRGTGNRPPGQHPAAAGRPGRVRPAPGTGGADGRAVRPDGCAGQQRLGVLPDPVRRDHAGAVGRAVGGQPARAVLPLAGGAIVNIADIHGERRPLPGHAVYGMGKAALLYMTRALALELAPAVRVNAVAPGAILWPEGGKDRGEREAMLAMTPLARTGTVDEVASAVCWLLRGASYTTGEVLRIDGGRS